MKSGYHKWAKQQPIPQVQTEKERLEERIKEAEADAKRMHNFRWHILATTIEAECAVLKAQLARLS